MAARRPGPKRPQPTTAERLAAVLDRANDLATDRLDIALWQAHARHALMTFASVELGPTPSVAAVYAQRELRLAIEGLARLVAPVEAGPEPGADEELAILVAAIRGTRRPNDDEAGSP